MKKAMQLVEYFYHVTSPKCKIGIEKVQTLIPQIHNPSADWMRILGLKHEKEIPKGVWFCSTLFNNNLPTRSPYGEHRIKIPIENVISQLGGKVSLYQGETANKNGNTYIRLMLVKDGDNFECLKHMKKLDLKNNDFLKWISNSQFQVAERPIWVETFVPYMINTSYGTWDTVQRLSSI